MSLKDKSISGVKWMSISKFVIVGVSIIKISVLTRFLEKSDFGLMAIINVVLGFMYLFMNMGFNIGIIHKLKISINEYSSLYFMNILLSLVVLFFVILAAPYIAQFYDDIRLIELIYISSSCVIISAIGKQFNTILQKKLKFKLIFFIDVISNLINLFVGISLAIYGFGVYALVYSLVASLIIENILYFSIGIKQNPIKFHLKLSEVKPFLKIGVYQVGGQIINFFNRDLDTILIGKLLGSEILGMYSLAKQLVFRPSSIINPIITTVASPALAIIQNSKEYLKTTYLKILNLITSLNFIVYTLLCIVAYPVVLVLYGENFIEIVPLVQLLCLYMFFRSIGNPIGSLVVATGRTDLEFYWNFISLLIMPIFIVIGAKYNFMGVALCLNLFMLLSIYPFYKIIIYRLLKINFQEYINCIVRFNFSYMTDIFLKVIKK